MDLNWLGPNSHVEGGVSATQMLRMTKGKARELLAEEGKVADETANGLM